MSASAGDILPEYERELAILRRSLGEFARRHPQAATRLGISGEHSDDPHVERLIQSTALLNARVSGRLNDDFPELPSALLEILYPEYLRPFPSCSIAHFDDAVQIEKLTSPFAIERGTELKTRTGEYRFRTVYDVVLAPLRIAAARYAPATSAPANIRLNQNTTGIVSISFAPLTENAMRRGSVPDRLRVFVDGDRRMVSAVMDTLLLCASTAFVEVDGSGQWIILDAVPMSACGFGLEERLIERLNGKNNRESQFRVLLEYFSFPEKFDFIEVDLSALMRIAGTCKSVTVHVPIIDVHHDSPRAQLLQRFSASNFKLFCTPVINLFTSDSEPIPLKEIEIPVYPIVPSTLNGSDASVYRIDAVRITEDTNKGPASRQIEPYQSLSHHLMQPGSAIYWLAERDGRLAEFLPGQDLLLSLVDSSGEMLNVSATQLDADLTCTNGDLPASLRIGASKGDLQHANEKLIGRVSMLRSPTQSIERSQTHYQLWDIVAMLSAGALSLCQAGLPAFKKLLRAHTPSQAASANRHIESLTFLSREHALEWVVKEPQPMLVRGIRVRLAVDDTRLSDCAVSVFARVLESLFVHYAPANSFVQLVQMSAQNGAELITGRPLPGDEVLL